MDSYFLFRRRIWRFRSMILAWHLHSLNWTLCKVWWVAFDWRCAKSRASWSASGLEPLHYLGGLECRSTWTIWLSVGQNSSSFVWIGSALGRWPCWWFGWLVTSSDAWMAIKAAGRCQSQAYTCACVPWLFHQGPLWAHGARLLSYAGSLQRLLRSSGVKKLMLPLRGDLHLISHVKICHGGLTTYATQQI